MHLDGQPDHLFAEVARQQHPWLPPCFFVTSVLITSLYESVNRPADARPPEPDLPPKPIRPGTQCAPGGPNGREG